MKLREDDEISEYLKNDWWVDETWHSLLAKQVIKQPSRVAVVDAANRKQWMDGDPKRLTWQELAVEVDELAVVLHAHGIRTGDIVLIQLPNSAELVATYFALSRLGAIASPLPIQYREYEIAQLGAYVGAVAIITSTRIGERQNLEVISGARAELPNLRSVFAWGDGIEEPTVGLNSEQAGHAAREVAHDYLASRTPSPSDCVTICWTSGTEGVPKAVPRAHGDWIAMAWGNVDGPQLTADDVLLNPFPMVNMAGISGMFLSWLISGSVLVQHQPFDLPTFLQQIESEGVTYTLAPPALLTKLLQQPELIAGAKIDSLRVLGSGSAPLAPSLLQGWVKDHGLEIINCFGSNEGMCFNGDPRIVPDAEERARFFPRFGAEGYEWPIRSTRGFRSKLVDAASGETISEAGRAGEMWIKGPNVFAGYWTPTGLDRSGFDENGFFGSGEIFEIAEVAGDPRYYHYVSRQKDLIVRGGMNISPAEIEGLIASHHAVQDVAVVGYEDAELGERSCAFVVTKPDTLLKLADVISHLRSIHVASYKLPEKLEIIDELPRNPVGKVLKGALRTQLETHPGRDNLAEASL